jgi:hypothetical protein
MDYSVARYVKMAACCLIRSHGLTAFPCAQA